MDTPEHNHADDAPAPEPARSPWLGWSIAVVAVAMLWVGACSMQDGGGDAPALEGWVDGLDAGKAQAAEADKPIIVMFTADWCGPCQKFKSKVLANDQVKAALGEGFVAVKVDLSDRSSKNPHQKTASDYGVRGIPTLMALKPDGKVIDKFTGKRTPEAFNEWLDGLEQ